VIAQQRHVRYRVGDRRHDHNVEALRAQLVDERHHCLRFRERERAASKEIVLQSAEQRHSSARSTLACRVRRTFTVPQSLQPQTAPLIVTGAPTTPVAQVHQRYYPCQTSDRRMRSADRSTGELPHNSSPTHTHGAWDDLPSPPTPPVGTQHHHTQALRIRWRGCARGHKRRRQQSAATQKPSSTT
jgi:hypothetical protein